MRLYHALWDAYEHPAAPPSALPRACPDGYQQVRGPCLLPMRMDSTRVWSNCHVGEDNAAAGWPCTCPGI